MTKISILISISISKTLELDTNINTNTVGFKIQSQSQYQYPKMIKFKLNLKTIPRYLDILLSQDNTQKIRASIAQLCCSINLLNPGLEASTQVSWGIALPCNLMYFIKVNYVYWERGFLVHWNIKLFNVQTQHYKRIMWDCGYTMLCFYQAWQTSSQCSGFFVLSKSAFQSSFYWVYC